MDEPNKIAEAISTITNYLNGHSMPGAIEGAVNALQHEHRTLQASFWRFIKELASRYKDFNYDLRNEDAVKFAKKISEIEQGIRFI